MLENIMLKVEFLLRKNPDRSALVVLDSINSLAIHNNTKILSEFLHILVNNLRARGAYTVIISMQEYETEEIRNMLVLVSDEALELGVCAPDGASLARVGRPPEWAAFFGRRRRLQTRSLLR